jgi:hypothetical protein
MRRSKPNKRICSAPWCGDALSPVGGVDRGLFQETEMSTPKSIRDARKAKRNGGGIPISAVLEVMRGHMRGARRTRPEASAQGRRVAQTKGK